MNDEEIDKLAGLMIDKLYEKVLALMHLKDLKKLRDKIEKIIKRLEAKDAEGKNELVG